MKSIGIYWLNTITTNLPPLLPWRQVKYTKLRRLRSTLKYTGGLSMEVDSRHLTGNLAKVRGASGQQGMVLHFGEIHLCFSSIILGPQNP